MKIFKTANYKKTARNPRYKGQLEGDENRPQSSSFQEAIQDNELVEGEHVKMLRTFLGRKDWNKFEAYVQKLKDEGHSEHRIQTMISNAIYKAKL